MQPAGITPEIGGIGTENPSFLMELKERVQKTRGNIRAETTIYAYAVSSSDFQ